MTTPVPLPARASRPADWYLCVGITLLVGLLHGLNLCSAGALWRDEAGGVHLASQTSAAEMWRMLARDSFPLFFPSAVRCWSALGLGGDLGLRALGCCVGLATLAALWLPVRPARPALPVASLLLFALNPLVIRWGDSLRAYGCGTLFVILTFYGVWRYVSQPSGWRFALAALGGLLSVQCLYQNAFLLLAICGGAALVCWRRREPTRAGLALALGLPAALSLIPYVPLIRASQQWWLIEKTGFRPLAVSATLWDAWNSPPWLGPLVWLAFWLAATVRVFRFLESRSGRRPAAQADVTAYGAAVACFGLLLFGLFVALSGLPTQPWYWLSLLGLLAVCFDAAFAPLWRDPPRWLVPVLVVAAGLVAVGSFSPLSRRITNVDLVAAELKTRVQPSDLVLVYPWYCGVSFHRYYHAPADWMTVPDLSDHGFHRYDLLKEQLRAASPLQPVLQRVRQTLVAGHSVWIVGGLPPVPPGNAPPAELPPAPDGPQGWYDEPYNASWGVQLAYALQTQAQQLETMPLAASVRVERYESLVLTRAQGYRGALFTQPP